MTHEDLLEIGFELCGIEENDPYYKIVFSPPFNFEVYYLSGQLNDGLFELYANNKFYSNKNELKKVIDIVGSEIRK